MTATETRLIVRNPRLMSGTPVFAGTRIPVKTLFDYLKAGDSLEVFLESYPSISREQAQAMLTLAQDALLAER